MRQSDLTSICSSEWSTTQRLRLSSYLEFFHLLIIYLFLHSLSFHFPHFCSLLFSRRLLIWLLIEPPFWTLLFRLLLQLLHISNILQSLSICCLLLSASESTCAAAKQQKLFLLLSQCVCVVQHSSTFGCMQAFAWSHTQLLSVFNHHHHHHHHLRKLLLCLSGPGQKHQQH